MSAASWRERREAYLRERGRWVDLIREGYVQHHLTVIEGAGRRREGGRSPALVLVADTAAHREAEQRKQRASSRPDTPVA
jgi:hypothetical protein